MIRLIAGALGDGGDDPLLLGLDAGDRRPRRLAVDVAADVVPGARAVLLRPPDERLVAQIRAPDGGAARQAVALREHADHRLAARAAAPRARDPRAAGARTRRRCRRRGAAGRASSCCRPRGRAPRPGSARDRRRRSPPRCRRSASVSATAAAVRARRRPRRGRRLSACSARASISRDSASSALPAAVSVTPRRLRSKSCTPSSVSNVLICCDTLGCARNSRCAARWKCSSSATATNVRSWRSSMTADDRRRLSQTQALLFAIAAPAACTVRHMEGFRPYDIADPFPFYARARAEAPVFFSDELGYYVVSRYEDIQAIFKDPATFSSENTQTPFKPRPPEVQAVFDEAGVSHASGLSGRQPPDHTRLRGFIKKAFTPRRIAALEPQVRALTVEAIDAFAARRPRRPGGRAGPRPARRYVIFRLLGVPDEDVPRVKEWAISRVYLNFGDIGVDEQVHHARALVEYWRYCLDLVDRSFEHPGDDLPGDLARIYLEGDRSLTREEIAGLVHTQLFAGHETTSSLLGAGLAELLQQPGPVRGAPRRPDADPDRGRGAAAARHARVRVEARHEMPGPRRRHRPPRERQPAPAARLGEPRRHRLRRPRRDRPAPRERPQAPRVRPRHPLLPRRRARAARGPGRARRAHATAPEPANDATDAPLHAQHHLPRPRVAPRRVGPGDRAARATATTCNRSAARRPGWPR